MLTAKNAKRQRPSLKMPLFGARTRSVGLSGSGAPQGPGWPKELADGAWKGHRAIVLGAGPSLAGFNLARIRGERIIAVNRAAESCPWATIAFTIDTQFQAWLAGRRLGEKSAAAWRGFTGARVQVATGGPNAGALGWRRIRYRPGERGEGTIATGLDPLGNSGYGALRLAIALGANPIHLLGFDFAYDHGRTHFHDPYPTRADERRLAAAAHRIERGAEWIERAGIQVINHSPGSRLRTFPKASILDLPMPRPDFLLTSFWTDAAYQAEAEKLRASAERFGISHDIREVPSRGGWIRNVEQKPDFLKAQLERHPGRNIVWVDADARIQRYPLLFHDLEGQGADLAVHYLPWPGGARRELLGGTIWLRNNGKIGGIMDEWIAESRLATKNKDQISLERILAREPDRLKVAELPANYCQIYDIMRKAGQPVIEHFQASRRYRRTAK